jgi:hypothetical protein
LYVDNGVDHDYYDPSLDVISEEKVNANAILDDIWDAGKESCGYC